MGASIIPQVNAILYSLLLFDERVDLRVCTIRAYQMCLDIFPQVDLNAATEINWNLPGE